MLRLRRLRAGLPGRGDLYEDDTPEQWKEYYDANVHFFDDLGSAGGAAKMGVIDNDHAISRRSSAGARRVKQRDLSSRLPDFPWDHLTAYAIGRARILTASSTSRSGLPVDPPPRSSSAPARCRRRSRLPDDDRAAGTRQACVDWLGQELGVTGLGLDAVLPVIGSKELIASLAVHLGLGPGDLVV